MQANNISVALVTDAKVFELVWTLSPVRRKNSLSRLINRQ